MVSLIRRYLAHRRTQRLIDDNRRLLALRDRLLNLKAETCRDPE